MIPNILERILNQKRIEVSRNRATVPLDELRARLPDAPEIRDFLHPLQSASTVGLIAEIKRASPSAGTIRHEVDPVETALCYQLGGAHCLSVLTDATFFSGSLDDLRAVRAHTHLPILRKDFVIDRYQVWEARIAGADAILLIAECLDDCTLRDLYYLSHELGMECLVEIYEECNVERVLKLQPSLVGVNNRNLRTFEVDLNHTCRLAPFLREHALLIAESGIKSAQDVQRLRDHGVRGILVGETLMRADNPAEAVRQLISL